MDLRLGCVMCDKIKDTIVMQHMHLWHQLHCQPAFELLLTARCRDSPVSRCVELVVLILDSTLAM